MKSEQPPFPNPRSPEQAFRNYEFHQARAKVWRRRRNFFIALLAGEALWLYWRYWP